MRVDANIRVQLSSRDYLSTDRVWDEGRPWQVELIMSIPQARALWVEIGKQLREAKKETRG